MDGDAYIRSRGRGDSVRAHIGRPIYRTTGQWANPGQGIVYSIEGDELVFRVNLKQDFGLSGSGKSRTIGNSSGSIAIGTLDCAKGKDIPEYLVAILNVFNLVNPKKAKRE